MRRKRLDPAPEGSFSIAALPDTQDYSSSDPDTFYAETMWLARQKNEQRIAFVSHLGDMVDNNTQAEWKVANKAMSALDETVPYGICIGNGDMACKEGDASAYLQVFPSSRFHHRPWYGGCAPVRDNCDSYQMFDAGGIPLLAMHLEVNATDDVLAWANRILRKHADRWVIISTHMFLGPIQKPESKREHLTSPKGVMEWIRCHDQRGNTPLQLWEKCFRRHPNILLILCGDQSRTQTLHLPMTGDLGNRVHACLSDYRGGNLRLYRFQPDHRLLSVITYTVPEQALCLGTEIAPREGLHQFVLPLPDLRRGPQQD